MIYMISIFSLLLILIGASLTVVSTKISLNKELKSCISITTTLNQERRNTLNHLFSLNGKAKMLRQQRKVAEEVYRAAPAQAKAAAFAALQLVKFAQFTFRSYQRGIIYKLKGETLKFTTKVLTMRYTFLKRPRLNLVSSYPKKSDSPSYKAIQKFSNVSKVLVRKKIVLNQNFPSFFKKLLRKNKGYIECGSNMISKEDNKIEIKLLGGRSF